MFVFIYDENDECFPEFDRSEHVVGENYIYITRYKDGKVVEKSRRRRKK